MKAVCKRVDERGSTTERKPGSGRLKTARTEQNIERVNELNRARENKSDLSALFDDFELRVLSGR